MGDAKTIIIKNKTAKIKETPKNDSKMQAIFLAKKFTTQNNHFMQGKDLGGREGNWIKTADTLLTKYFTVTRAFPSESLIAKPHLQIGKIIIMPENKDLENVKQKFPVPQGFRELLESLAREVLRGQPPNIYEFSALFFEYLLQKQSENEGECVIDNAKLYEEFKMELFTEVNSTPKNFHTYKHERPKHVELSKNYTEYYGYLKWQLALKQGMVSPLVGPMLGIDVVPSPRTSYVRDLQQQYAKETVCRPLAPLPASSTTPDGFYDNYEEGKPATITNDGNVKKPPIVGNMIPKNIRSVMFLHRGFEKRGRSGIPEFVLNARISNTHAYPIKT
uniref:RIIa domain-containing protein n=1 Tax=Romanomermis culicivorax TaxID=13658 RepID=A0A915J4S2_ROMCU